MRILELKIPPVALTVIFAVVMWATSVVFSVASVPLPGAAIIAVAIAFVGGAIGVAGVFAFRQHSTTVNPMHPETTASVVTVGIYRVTRNPMYLGLALVLVGWSVYLANVASLLLVLVFVAYMTLFQIKPEERALLGKFGPDFADYMTTVRRWI